MNSAQTRVSVMTMIVAYLAQSRGHKADRDRVVDVLSPPSLSPDQKHQSDVQASLMAAIMIGLVEVDGKKVALPGHVERRSKKGVSAVAGCIRELVFAEQLNQDKWGGQGGARELTNSLAYFLSFSASTVPTKMRRTGPKTDSGQTLEEVQTADFGPRQESVAADASESDGWPIGNKERWQSFRRWACSLGFAWLTPKGVLIPDPTVAVRDVIPRIFQEDDELAANDFVSALGRALPVLETGSYRRFVEDNWRRDAVDPLQLSSPTTDALLRLESEGLIAFSDQADAKRVTRSDGGTISHVLLGGSA